MNQYFHPNARQASLKGTAKNSHPAFWGIPPSRSVLKMETGPQTTQLIMYLNPSSRFLNLTYCNDIIKNVIRRERSKFFIGM